MIKRFQTLALLSVLLTTLLTSAGCGAEKATESPTATPQPTLSPTSKATVPPPTTPTATPSTEPKATERPTEQPTERPTKQPAEKPTLSPTPPPATPDTSGLSPAVAGLVDKLEGLELADFFEVSWRELMLRNPEQVVEFGLTEIYGVQDAQLTNISDAYIRETYQMYRVILEMLQRYDRDALTPQDQISYDVYEWYLQDQLRGQAFMYYDYPATYFPVTAVHEQLIQFFTDLHPIANKQDAEDYVTRLGQVGVKFEQLLEGLRLREEAGIIPPKFATQWALYGSVRSLAHTSATQTPFYETLAEKAKALPDLSDAERQALLEQAAQAIDDVVLPAYRDLEDYLEHLESIGSADAGVWQFPEGEAYYDYLLHHHTTLDPADSSGRGLTADEIHELGLQELERIHAEMRAVFDQLGYPQDDSLPELFDRVAQDGGQVSGNQVLETYEALIEQADQNLDAFFDIRPQAQVIVVGDTFGGFYIPGSIDGSRPGAFYAAVGGTEDYYGMPTLAYHEAIPGHHWQIAIAQETDLPSFRRGMSFTGYAEGWALYAERLAWELGWYDDDPYGNLGRLQAEAFRAARLVVDTGIHTRGWTFDEALKFFVENVGFERDDLVNPEHQIARYIVWPGQSTAYKVGMLKLLELRQRAMDQLGDRFDLQEFHRVVLGNGSMPLEILERVVDQYIQEKLKQSAFSDSILFEKSAQTFPAVPTWKIGLADLDEDGDLDAVFANGQANDSQVWLNDGCGSFTDTGQQLGGYGHGVDVGDIDGDGDPDIVISTHVDSAASRVYLNDGNAVFQALEGAFDANIGFSVELFDIDGDGDLDAVGEGTDTTNVYLNDGEGHFTASETTFPLTTIWGDLDVDGDIDVFIKEKGVGYSVRLNDGAGNFSPHWNHADPTAMRIGDMALGDVDNDGDPDAVITNGHFRSTSHPTLVFTNDGTGQFTDSEQRLGAVQNAGVGLGDLDNDGDLDLVLANYMEPCQIWLNDGSGEFTDSGFRFGGDQFYRHVHLGDLTCQGDGDRNLDIFLATFGTSGGPNEIWFNQGQ